MRFVRQLRHVKQVHQQPLGAGGPTIERLETRVFLHAGPHDALPGLHIDAGAKVESVASDGTTWTADQHFTSGKSVKGSRKLQVDATDADAIFTSVRQGKQFGYDIPVESGTYDVMLHFVDARTKKAGKRLFDVQAEGAPVLSNLDIVAEVGRRVALTKMLRLDVADGTLNLNFSRIKGAAIVSAIDVHRVETDMGDGTVGGDPSDPAGPTDPAPPPSQTITWASGPDLPMPLSELAPLVIGGKVYVFGGYDQVPSYTSTNTVHRFDPVTNTWTRMADMPERVSHLGHVADERYGYFAGAYVLRSNNQQTFASSSVYQYDSVTDTYTALPALPRPRGAGGLGLIGRELHFVGGFNIQRQSETEHWSLNLDNLAAGWQVRPDVPVPLNHFGVVSVGNAMYLVGGQKTVVDDPDDASIMYRWTNDEGWTQLTSLPEPRSHSGGATFFHDGRIYMMGGYGPGTSVESDVFIYDIASNTWTTGTPLPAVRHSGAGVAIGDKIYYTAGWTHGALQDQLQKQLWIGSLS